MKIFTFTRALGAFAILFLFSMPAAADELFSTQFGVDDNWWSEGSMTGYNEKSYTEGDWYFHSTSSVRGTSGESYGGSDYSFRDRDVFTLHNTAQVNGMSGFSLQLRDWMLGSGEQRDLKVSYDGGDNWETLITINKDWFDDYQVYQEYAYTFPDGPQSFAAEDFQLEIDGGGDTNDGRINIGQFVAYGEMTTVATPVFSPSGGTFFEDVEVEITTSTPGADIYYTLNGADPTEDDILYTDPIQVTEDLTIKARAFADDFDPSNVAEETYLIRTLILEKDFEDEDLFSGGWTVYDFIDGANTWTIDDFAGNYYAMITEYQSDPAYPHSWYFSPEIDLADMEEVTFSFYSQTAFREGDALSVHISSDYTEGEDPNNATWTMLEADLDPHTGGGYGSWTHSGDIDLSDYQETVHIAFQYESDEDNNGNWHVDDILITAMEPTESSDNSLAVFTIGDINVLNLGGIEVDDPETDDGATLYVEDFFGFEGIEVEPNHDLATYEVTVNDVVIDEEDLEDHPIEFEDVVVVEVTAEDQSIQYYKVTVLGEERILVIIGPGADDTFYTHDDVTFSWEAENITELLFERFREGEDEAYYSEVLDGDQEEINFEVPNGVHGMYFFRVSDNNDPSFYEDSELFEVIDDVDPSLTDKEPESGSENIDLEPTLKMWFDEDVFAGEGHIEIYRHDDDELVLSIPADGDHVTIAEDEVHVQIDEALNHETTYYVLVDDDAIADIAGNHFEGIADPQIWTFTTEIMDDPDALICNGDFEHWSDGLPECWYGDRSNIGAGNVNQYDADAHTGSYSAQLVNESDGHQRFTSQHANLDEGVTYQITFWIKGHGEIRTGLFDDRETGYGYAPYNSYIDADPDNWEEYSQLVSAANTTDIGEFIFSLRNTTDNHILLDNVSVEVYEDDPEEMENIAALRAGEFDTPYTLTGEVILTYQMDYRNQKFIQDETAAIMIDDSDGIIATSYDRYDGITGISGMLTQHNNMLQFTPSADPGEPTSTGNELVPETRQLDDLTYDDQAKLIQLSQVTFEDAGATFDAGDNYTIYDPSGAGIFRTSFFDAEYIDDEIPHEEQIITVLVSQYQEDIQVTARDWDDFEIWVSVPETGEETMAVYPNPFSDQIRISGADNLETVQLLNARGQVVREVRATDGETLLSASELQPGIYFLRLQFEDGSTSTQKIMKQ